MANNKKAKKNNMTMKNRIADLERSIEEHRSIINLTGDIIVQFDIQGRWTFLNDCACEFWGSSRSKLLGKKFIDFLHPDDHEITLDSINKAISGKIIKSLINRQKTPAGWRTVQWNGTVINENGKCITLQATGRDITKQLEAEEGKKKLESIVYHSQKMYSIGQLAAGIAHEFNNILTIIKSAVQIHLMDKNVSRYLSKELIEDLNNIDNNCDRAADIVKQLMSYGIKTDHDQPEVKNIDISSIVRGTCGNLKNVYKFSTGHKLICDVNARNHVTGDIILIQQIIDNLVLNARDAMSNGGIIRLTTEDVIIKGLITKFDKIPAGSYVKFSVSDKGSGITDKELSRIFEPFYTTKEPGKGTGLGLFVIYGLIKNICHAYIDVRTRVGKGTCIDIYFPAKEGKKKIRKSSMKKKIPRKNNRNILFVDDEPGVRNSFSRYFNRQGYDVIEAKSAMEALNIYQDGDIDLTITDMVMENKGGDFLAEKIMNLDPEAKIFIISGYQQSSNIEKLVKEGKGRICFIPKPFDFTDLKKRVEKVIEDK
jgi:PAS domain S-box-containing protein